MPVSILVGSLIRAAVFFALGGLITKGWLTTDAVEKIATYAIGIFGVLGMSAWVVIRSTLVSILDRISKIPEVAKIEVLDPEVAAETGPKVVSASQQTLDDLDAEDLQ